MLTYFLLIPLLGLIGVLFVTESKKSKNLALGTFFIICIFIFSVSNSSEIKNLNVNVTPNIDPCVYYFAFGSLVSYIIFTFITKGWLGKIFKVKGAKVLKNKVLFNTYFIFFIILYFLIFISIDSSIIGLDSTDSFSVSIEGTKIEVTVLSEIGKKYGPHFAFLTGLRIGAALVSKGNMALTSKIGATVATGSASALGYSITMDGYNLFKVLVQQPTQNTTNTFAVKINLSSSNPQSYDNTSQILTNIIDPNIFIPSSKTSVSSVISEHGLTNNFNSILDKLNIINTSTNVSEAVDSKIIAELSKSRNLAEVFAKGVEVHSDLSVTIANTPSLNSPLESHSLDLVISILTKDLLLHSCMLYLIFNLLIMFTIKLIADKNLYTPYWESKVKSLPLGNIINILLLKLIASWRLSSVLWIYFVIFSLFIATCFSTFGVYACLTGLKG